MKKKIKKRKLINPKLLCLVCGILLSNKRLCSVCGAIHGAFRRGTQICDNCRKDAKSKPKIASLIRRYQSKRFEAKLAKFEDNRLLKNKRSRHKIDLKKELARAKRIFAVAHKKLMHEYYKDKNKGR